LGRRCRQCSSALRFAIATPFATFLNREAILASLPRLRAKVAWPPHGRAPERPLIGRPLAICHG
jgi:hypothetical protein